MMTRRNGSIIITGATASTRGASGHVAFSSAMVSYTGCLDKNAPAVSSLQQQATGAFLLGHPVQFKVTFKVNFQNTCLILPYPPIVQSRANEVLNNVHILLIPIFRWPREPQHSPLHENQDQRVSMLLMLQLMGLWTIQIQGNFSLIRLDIGKYNKLIKLLSFQDQNFAKIFQDKAENDALIQAA